MLAPNAARAALAVKQRSPREIGQLGGTTNSTHNTQANISATLRGDEECEAVNVVVTGHAPVLKLCRELLAQGVDPDTALTVYRRGIVALKVRSIGEAARLTVKTAGNGTPIFVVDDSWQGAGASGMRSCPDSDTGEGGRP
jgi:hypothetical protein